MLALRIEILIRNSIIRAKSLTWKCPKSVFGSCARCDVNYIFHENGCQRVAMRRLATFVVDDMAQLVNLGVALLLSRTKYIKP